MIVADLIKTMDLKVITGNDLSTEITGVYTGDLLSHVMSKAQSQNIWITVQTNINIVAVASLCEVSCIVLPENITPTEETIHKAEEEGIVILSFPMSTYNFITEFNKI